MNIIPRAQTKAIIEDLRKRYKLAKNAKIILKAAPAEPDDTNEYRFGATITTTTLDRDNEVIIASGVDLSEYRKNPVVLWSHDMNRPVAQAISLTQSNQSIKAVAEFAKRPGDLVGPFFPDEIRAYVAQKIVRACSIGFVAVEFRYPTAADLKQWPGVERVYPKVLMLEFSWVSIPSNPQALTDDGKQHHGRRAATVDAPDDPEMLLCTTCGASFPRRPMDDIEDDDDEDRGLCAICRDVPAEKRLVLNIGGPTPKRLILYVRSRPRMKRNPEHLASVIKAEISKARGAIYVLESLPPALIPDDGGDDA